MLARHRRHLLVPLLGLVAAFTFSACQPVLPPVVSNGPALGVQASQAAVTQVGVRYTYGGASPAQGFDCSGLVMWAWEQAGVSLARTASDQYATTTRIARTQLRAGDLVFYGTGGVVSHVALYIGSGRLMQANKPGVAANENSLATYWTTALIGYGRVKLAAG